MLARHVVLGAAARGTTVAGATLRLTFVPFRPLLRGVASNRAWALAYRGEDVERGLIESALRRLDEVAAVVVDHFLTSPETERLISRTLERPELERLIVIALDSPATDRLVQRVLATPGVELAITRVLESELLDAATARFLESEEIERVIARIAEGPELRAAVAAQSAGLADMVAEEIRDRSVGADDTAERLARSLIPRRWRHGPPAGAPGT